MLGERDRALETIDHGLLLVERNGDLFNVPELLRIKGDILASGAPSGRGALSWELRTALSLARLWSEQGRVDDAIVALSSPYERFNEGFDSPDLRHAKGLLDELRARVGLPQDNQKVQAEAIHRGRRASSPVDISPGNRHPRPNDDHHG